MELGLLLLNLLLFVIVWSGEGERDGFGGQVTAADEPFVVGDFGQPAVEMRDGFMRNGKRKLASVAAPCDHVEEVRADWGPAHDPVCEDCARAGESGWVSLRRCLTCGHVGCCDSSPGHHATEHHRETAHPAVQTLQPGQDWVWCYVDEITMRHVDGGWVVVDLFFEAGLGYMRDHLQAGGEPAVDERFTFGKGFPLGRWVAEMQRKNAAGELTTDQKSQIDQLPGWLWDG